MIITVEYIKAKVEVIRTMAHDPEAAHSLEDALYKEVLTGIITGSVEIGSVVEIADAALDAQDIKFNRWCA